MQAAGCPRRCDYSYGRAYQDWLRRHLVRGLYRTCLRKSRPRQTDDSCAMKFYFVAIRFSKCTYIYTHILLINYFNIKFISQIPVYGPCGKNKTSLLCGHEGRRGGGGFFTMVVKNCAGFKRGL